MSHESYYQKTADFALAGLSGDAFAQGMEYVRILVDHWLEDSHLVEADDLFDVGKSDLQAALRGLTAPDRLAALQALALKPRVQQTSLRAFKLAQQAVDDPARMAALADEARQIARQVDSLLGEVKALTDETLKKRLMRDLADADLELNYILGSGEGAMSIRLNHYQSSR